jgi:8-oxo-dGTP diphosphatase
MNSKLPQITRYGAYGVILQNSKLLLNLKKSGPYKGLWDLPGGGIEFNETPEEALKRELMEETALAGDQLELLSIATSTGQYEENDNEYYQFHHIGIIYKVLRTTPIPHLVPEEVSRWVLLNKVRKEELTPFAKHVTNLSLVDSIIN